MQHLHVTSARDGMRGIVYDGYLITVSAQCIVEEDGAYRLLNSARILGTSKCEADECLPSNPLMVPRDFLDRAHRAIEDFIGTHEAPL